MYMNYLMNLFLLTPVLLISGIILTIITNFTIKSLSMSRKILIFSIFLILTILSMNLIVSYYKEDYADTINIQSGQVYDPMKTEKERQKTFVEHLSSSFIYTLQSFSTDADYQEFMSDTESFFRDYAKYNHVDMVPGTKEYGLMNLFLVLIAALNIAAPISGGAIILDVLTFFIPVIKLAFIPSTRRKYYFSCLSERTLALAKSIYADESVWYKKKPVFIFTDAFDDDDDGRSHLMAEAASIGAICVKSDLISTLKKGRKNYVFLMNDEESENLRMIISLSDKKNWSKLERAEVYIFCEKSYTPGIAAEVNSKMDEYVHRRLRKMLRFAENLKDAEKNTLKGKIYEFFISVLNDMRPKIISVKSYQNMITNLYNDVPLFEPFLTKNPIPAKDRKRLVLTIAGSGNIGTEAFLTATWCTQMSGIDLVINIISSEPEEEFYSHIDRINPDILKTGKEGNELLRFREGASDYTAPYFTLSYFKEDLNEKSADQILSMKNEQGISLAETDYFIIALGEDDRNIEYADKLRISIERKMLSDRSGEKTDPYKKKVIAYAVYESSIARSLNLMSNESDSRASERINPCMYAFGDMESLYSKKNVFMSMFVDSSEEIEKIYQLRQSGSKDDGSSLYDKNIFGEKNLKRFKDEYSYQANNARAAHQPYKAFSVGIEIRPVFDEYCVFKGVTDRDAISDEFYELTSSDKLSMADKSRLIWLEHRRWNAFMRTQGFRHATAEELKAYSALSGKKKDLSAKLHNCIVECEPRELTLAEMTDEGYFSKKTGNVYDPEKYDLLDKECFNAETNYKYYDMPVSIRVVHSK